MFGRLLSATLALAVGLSTTAVLAAGQRPPKSKIAKPAIDSDPAPAEADPLTPTDSNTGPAIAPGAAAAAALAQAQSPAAEPDPIVVEVKKRLTDQRSGNTDKTGLAAFYEKGNSQPVWTAKDGFTPRAQAVIAEMAGVVGDTGGRYHRRYQGPFGKSDRAVVLGFCGAWLALGWPLAGWALQWLPYTWVALCAVTIWNRGRAFAK